jgi:agmatine/peptidylarginine deiminase
MKQQHKSFMGQFQAARQEVAQLKTWMGESAKVATLTFPTRTTAEGGQRAPAIHKKKP